VDQLPGAAVSVFPLLVIVHALAATVWTGGHLVLDLGVLPRALRERSAAQIRAFEEPFEPLGLTALAVHARLRLIPNLTDDNLNGWPGTSAASPPWRSPLWWWVP